MFWRVAAYRLNPATGQETLVYARDFLTREGADHDFDRIRRQYLKGYRLELTVA